ncbi:MAG: hypothetical protein IPJ48_16660 [Propionivibrio sp.]|uniref:Uncharacterized protein n=1 Tax=Candidatus Propionivibrio dominans TaxID=2954373 RepID=A0A9D7I8Q6_9RHOO|nr:hypothetical protein [Candidatus Propionivibrio dominans]
MENFYPEFKPSAATSRTDVHLATSKDRHTALIKAARYACRHNFHPYPHMDHAFRWRNLSLFMQPNGNPT